VSRAILEEHRRLWREKPVLEAVYSVWFDALLATLPGRGRVLEVGAGPGLLSAYARRRRPELNWVASDVIPAPWNDVVADGLRLPFRTASFDAILAIDLVHHLARPAAFFGETARVLKPQGHMAVVEPWVTVLSYPVYRFFHQEGCSLRIDPWDPFPGAEATGKDAFEGDAGVFWRLVRCTDAARWLGLGFASPQVRLLNGFAYLLSLGFRNGSLLPAGLTPTLLSLDRTLEPLASGLGLRALAVWRRTALNA